MSEVRVIGAPGPLTERLHSAAWLSPDGDPSPHGVSLRALAELRNEALQIIDDWHGLFPFARFTAMAADIEALHQDLRILEVETFRSGGVTAVDGRAQDD